MHLCMCPMDRPRRNRRRRRGKRGGFAVQLKTGWETWENAKQHLLSSWGDQLVDGLTSQVLSLSSPAAFRYYPRFLFHALSWDDSSWIKPGELCSLTKLVPQGCKLFNTPRPSGRSGGLVMVFKNIFPCQSLFTVLYRSFKVQLSQILLVNPVTVALGCCPKQNTDFLIEFAAFVCV